MTCAKCGHRFCWICLGAFDHVNHACNKYKEEHTVDKNSERAKLNKYMHYLLRYQTHDQSSKLEGKLMDIATQTMNELLEKGSLIAFFWLCLFVNYFVQSLPLTSSLALVVWMGGCVVCRGLTFSLSKRQRNNS